MVRAARRRRSDGRGRSTSSSWACHHEQQHQELLLMDAKHLLSPEPAPSRLRAARDGPPTASPRAPPRPRRARPTGWTHPTAASSRSATTATGFAYDNEGPAHTTCCCSRSPLADRLVTCGRVARLHRRRRLPAARAVAVRRVGRRPGPGLGGAAVLGAPPTATSESWYGVHPRRAPAAVDPAEPVAPRELLRGRRLRPLGRRTGSPPRRSGRWSPQVPTPAG